jgi:hypothetical protein
MKGAAGKARRRTLIWLIGAAVIALGLATWALTPPPAPKVRKEVGSLVAPGFAGKAGDVASITVTTAEETYHIVHGADGWVEPEKGNYKVATGRVDELVHAISGMSFAAPMTRDDKKFDRIGLGDPKQGGTGALVEIGDGKGATFFKMLVGYRDGRSYVREPDDLQAWAVKAETMPPLQRSARWLDLDIVSAPAASIREVEVQLAGRPAYRLLPKDPAGEQFALAPPLDQRRLVAPFAPTLPGQALSHFAPTDVAPVDTLKEAKLVADHVTHTKAGLEAAIHAYKVGDRGWATVSARAEAGAAPEATAQAAAINARATGWAFALGANDWSAFATPIEAIVEAK